MNPTFPFHELFLDMQGEIRLRCCPSNRAMLAMTCKTERKTAQPTDRTLLLFYLAYEGDVDGLLRKMIAYYSSANRGFFGICYGTDGWQHERNVHGLMHEAIRGQHLSLVKWFCDEWCGRDHHCSDKCINIAMATNDLEMIHTVVVHLFKYHAVGSVECKVTRAAMIRNKVDILEKLNQHCLLRLFMLADYKDENALDWWDAARYLLPMATIIETTCIVMAVTRSMIARGWTSDAIMSFYQRECPGILPAIRSNFIIPLGIQYQNANVLLWAWPQFCNTLRGGYVIYAQTHLLHKYVDALRTCTLDKDVVRALFAPEMFHGIETDSVITLKIQELVASVTCK